MRGKALTQLRFELVLARLRSRRASRQFRQFSGGRPSRQLVPNRALTNYLASRDTENERLPA